MSPSSQALELTSNRLEALTDGVFAIAMTLLVLELRISEAAGHLSSSELMTAIIGLFPNFLAYVISFAILGIFWVGHHNFFHLVKRVDRPFLWVNIFGLLFVSLIPFSAALLGRYGSEPVSIIVYALNLTLAGLVFGFGWRYATKHGLLDAQLDPKFVRFAQKHIMVAPVMYLFAIIASFFNPTLSMVILVVVPVYYILPNHLDLHAPWNPGHKHVHEYKRK